VPILILAFTLTIFATLPSSTDPVDLAITLDVRHSDPKAYVILYAPELVLHLFFWVQSYRSTGEPVTTLTCLLGENDVKHEICSTYKEFADGQGNFDEADNFTDYIIEKVKLVDKTVVDAIFRNFASIYRQRRICEKSTTVTSWGWKLTHTLTMQPSLGTQAIIPHSVPILIINPSIPHPWPSIS